MVSNKEVAIIELGLKDYQETWDFQENLFKQTVNIKIENRKNDSSSKPTPNYLIFCEHPHVYTLGKSGKKENLLLNDSELNEISASYYKVNRGGDITYHGPGQLVCYPILDLDNFFTDIHRYLRYLEEAVIQTLAEFNIPAGRIDGLTGVWIDFDDAQKARKICALGVKSSRWVTMHGLALNVNTDLKYFSYIIPCGIDDKAVTSMKQELGRSLDMQHVKSILNQKLLSIFGMIKQVDTKEQLK